jgi:hypothetical protein
MLGEVTKAGHPTRSMACASATAASWSSTPTSYPAFVKIAIGARWVRSEASFVTVLPTCSGMKGSP